MEPKPPKAPDDQPVVPLGALEVRRQPRSPGTGKDQVLYIAPDFDAPLEDFKGYC